MDKFKNDLFTLIEAYNPEHKPMSVEFLKLIIDMIPITPQRMGEWLATGKFNVETDEQQMQCSYCNGFSTGESIYCPHCGAKLIN